MKACVGKVADATAAESAGGRHRADVSELAGHSRTVLVWTVASRATGFLRTALLAAVLGPTFFGNLVQTTIILPYLVCQLLMASLVPAILTPHLVRLLDAGEREQANRMACSVFGLACACFAVAAVLTVLAAPLILPVLTAAVEDPAVRMAQRDLGWYLILCLAPQIPLFGVVSIGIAVQQAHRRFALATAAPAFENLGFGLVLALSAVVFGIGSDIDEIGHAQVLFIGIGASLAVACHAAVQWWGAFRLGVALRPRGGWLAPELRTVLRMALPSSGNAILVSLGWLAMLVVAGGIPGGAVAFQIAYNLFNLPIALCARPIATAQLPLMASRLAEGQNATALFHDALRLTVFVALPAAIVFLFMADQLALLVSVGGMRTEAGLGLVTIAIAGLGLALLGEAVMVVSSSAAYARHDAASPFRAMALQTTILCCGLVPIALLTEGPERLGAIGVVFSAATLTGGLYLYHNQLAAGRPPFDWSLGRDLVCAVLAVGVGIAILDILAIPAGFVPALTSLTVAALLYLALQWLASSRELAIVLQTVRPSGAVSGLATPGETRD
jgi:putative peptidoglycan lipid II flippase